MIDLSGEIAVVYLLSCPTLCNTVDCQAPSVRRIFQARILEWVAMPSSSGSSQPRDQTQVSYFAGRFFTIWATREGKVYILSFETLVLFPTWFPKQRVRFLASRQDTGRVFSWQCNLANGERGKKVLRSGFPNKTVQHIPEQWMSQFTFHKPQQCAWISQLVLFFKCKPFRRSLVIWEKLLMRKKWTKQTHGEKQLERNQDYTGRKKKTTLNWKIREDIMQ